MGKWHAEAARRAGAQLVAVVDRDVERARRIAGRAGCAIAPSLEALDAGVRPAVIHICTPTVTHDALTRSSLARGSHVLVEKPLAATAAATAALLQLAAKSQRLLCPVHQCVFQRGVRAVLERQSDLGEILHVRAATCSAGAERSGADPDSVAWSILPHHLSLIERFAPGALGTLTWMTTRPRAGEIDILGTGGAFGVTVMVSMHGRPTAHEMTIVGSRATAHFDLFHGFAVVEKGGSSRATKIRRPFNRAATQILSAGSNLATRAVARQSAYPGLWELVEGFYAAVAHGAAPPISASEALAVAEASDHIWRFPSS